MAFVTVPFHGSCVCSVAKHRIVEHGHPDLLTMEYLVTGVHHGRVGCMESLAAVHVNLEIIQLTILQDVIGMTQSSEPYDKS